MGSIKKFSSFIVAAVFAAVVGGSFFAAATPTAAFAADCSGKNVILTFPAWYRNLAKPDGSGCRIMSPTEVGGGSVGANREEQQLTKFVWTIVLNIIDIMLQLVGYISAGFIIYGGFLFLTSGGAPDGAAKARRTILNAVIGLILAIMSGAIVNFAARGLGIGG